MKWLYPRGSEWRKWDLHIHSDCGTTSKIVEKLISNQISVFSITDHSNVDRLDEFISVVQQKQNEGLEINLLPGIELRTDKGDKSVHITAIFPMVDKNGYEINVKYLSQNLLSKIDCSRSDIITAGREALKSKISENQLYRRGLIEKVVPFEKASKTIRKIGGLVIVHAGTKTSGIETEMKHAKEESKDYILNTLGHTKRALMKEYIDICELPNWNSSNLRERQFYSAEFGKPSVVFSDSHEIEQIGTKFTWIKADPTFDGLKHTKYEPLERIYLGEDLPRAKNDANVIDSIRIQKSNRWFDDHPIQLNDNLVAIIGERGAGKTAIADLMAYAGGDFHSDETDQTSFLYKALKSTKQIDETIENCEVEIKWKNGEFTSANITSNLSDYKDTKKVRYLSQSFIERKCNPAYAEEFQKEIENIIFQHIPLEERMGKTTFDDLKALRTKPIELKKENCHDKIRKINNEIQELRQQIDSLAKLDKEEKSLSKQNQQLIQQRPKTLTREEQAIEKKLSLATEQKDSLEEKISAQNAVRQKIRLVKTRMETLAEKIASEIEVISKELKAIGLQLIAKSIKLTIPSKIYTELNAKYKAANENIKALKGTDKDFVAWKEQSGGKLTQLTKATITAFSLTSVAKLVGYMESKSSIASEKRRIIKEIDSKTRKNTRRIDELGKEKKSITKEKKPLLEKKIKQRNKIYSDYISLLGEEKSIFDAMYSLLKTSTTDSEYVGHKKLEFFARIELNVDTFLEEAKRIIDFGKKGEYYQGSDYLFKVLKDMSETIELGERSDILTVMQTLYDSFTSGSTQNELPLKKGKQTLQFENWIFNVNHFKVNYSIRFEGTNIELLSPGKKGIILLLIYLTFDTESLTPLIIDQPEENLDNKSVYEELISFFRAAKRRRQIFVVTHNPNLVLNTDAEQIIIASFTASPKVNKCRISYISGAIENAYIDQKIPTLRKSIHEQGSDILEGGKVAFVKRQDKWAFST